MSTFYFFTDGIMELLGVVALFPRSWRLLYVMAPLTPSLALAVVVVPFVFQSLSWYLVRLCLDDALWVISAIVTTNNRSTLRISCPSSTTRTRMIMGARARRRGQ
jgi:MFS transporter, OCT family, solute carrier family 22 (organic cation transporter), member 4/5